MSLCEDVHVPHSTVKRVRMVAFAHDTLDAPFLLAVMVRRKTFFQENPSIVSFMM